MIQLPTPANESLASDASPLSMPAGDLITKVRQPSAQPDVELLALFLEGGDRSALEPLVVRYSGLVYSVVSRVVYQAQDREDACQATFLTLVRSASKIRHQKSIASWLYSVAFRIAIRIRQRSRSNAASLSVEDLQMIEQQSPDPLNSIAQDIEFEKLNRELQQLPQHLRDPLIEHYFLGHTASAIADRMELSVSAVEGRLRRGKQRLRTALARNGIGLSVVLGTVANWPTVSAAASHRLCDLCIQAIHQGNASALVLGSANASGGSSLSPSTLGSSSPVNPHVLSLVQGEIAMSTISLAKVGSGFGIGLCALLATATVSNWMLSEGHRGPSVSSMTIASSNASDPMNGAEVLAGPDDQKLESGALAGGLGGGIGEAGADGGGGSGLAGGGSIGSAGSMSGRGSMSGGMGGGMGGGSSMGALGQGNQQSWQFRSNVASSIIEKAKALLESEILSPNLLDSPLGMLEKISDLTELPIVLSKQVTGNNLNLSSLQKLDQSKAIGLREMSAGDALELLLDENDLSYVVHEKKIELVTKDEADQLESIRFYNVDSILKAHTESERKNLLDLLNKYVLTSAPQADASVLSSHLLVSCNESTHRRVAAFLGQIASINSGLEELSQLEVMGGGGMGAGGMGGGGMGPGMGGGGFN